MTDYFPFDPYPKQAAFLWLPHAEALYGGAAGGGKSVALLMGALQYVDCPGYHALILRRTYAQLKKPGALMDLAKEWLTPFRPKVTWNEADHKWTFPTGATITFGHMDTEAAKYDQQGANYHYVAFDELTQFTEGMYTYLFSRMRRRSGDGIPIRMRAASNPGGIGHCVPFGEVLTPGGWKDIREMAVGDPVYTVNPDGVMVASRVEQVHRSHYRGPMIRVRARGFRMACTPNHRVAKVGGVRPGLNTRGMKRDRFSLVPFAELPGQATILRSVSWRGAVPDALFIPPPVPTRKRKVSQPASLPMGLFLELLGWFLSEGSVVDRDKAFQISQEKPDNQRRIRELLDACGFKATWTASQATVYAADWWGYFRQFGRCRDKFVPPFVKELPPEPLARFFVTLVAGDGHLSKNGESGTYYTFSKALADDVAEIALKLGKIVSMHSRARANRIGREYQVHFKKATRSGGTELLTGNHVYKVSTQTKRKSAVTTEEYDGEVYCIGVPETHTFIIRQEGSVWVSGNSWVKTRFIEHPQGRIFLPAKLDDNPGIDKDAYLKSLTELDPITLQQLLKGDWDAYAGGRFLPTWFERRYRWVHKEFGQGGEYVLGPDTVRADQCWRFITVDPAASSAETARSDDPDYTVISVWAVRGNDLLWLDCVRVRLEIPDIVPEIERVYNEYKPEYVAIEAVAANRAVLQLAQRTRMAVQEVSPRGTDKLVRATKATTLAKAGRIWLPDWAPWLRDVEAELFRFTGNDKLDAHDDVIDTLSYAAAAIEEISGGEEARPLTLYNPGLGGSGIGGYLGRGR